MDFGEGFGAAVVGVGGALPLMGGAIDWLADADGVLALAIGLLIVATELLAVAVESFDEAGGELPMTVDVLDDAIDELVVGDTPTSGVAVRAGFLKKKYAMSTKAIPIAP